MCIRDRILARSLNAEIIRDGYGHVLNGDLLYQPYRVRGAGGEIAMVFRDHHLSNRIGFEYQHFRPEDAAADLVHRLQKIRENLSWSPGNHLVTLSLDGENAWEWYQGDKGPFLHSLYRRLSEEPLLRCCTCLLYTSSSREYSYSGWRTYGRWACKIKARKPWAMVYGSLLQSDMLLLYFFRPPE